MNFIFSIILFSMLHLLHQNERKMFARQLDLELSHFDQLLSSAEHAYDLFKNLGPFYGKENNNEPTFRITAEPVRLPLGSKELLKPLGQDLMYVGRALQRLPDTYKTLLGDELDFRLPITYRIDTIMCNEQSLHLNEIEGVDGASALMTVGQLAYHLQTEEETTISKLITLLHTMFPKPARGPLLIASLRSNIEGNPFTANARRFVEFIHEMSKGTIRWDLYDVELLPNEKKQPNWHKYAALLNEAYVAPRHLQALGIPIHKLIAAGNHNAIINKGVFALIHDPKLATFWKENLGSHRFERVRALLLPSYFITTPEELRKARSDGKVVKVTWAQGSSLIMNQSRGVALAAGNVEESQNDRWELLEECLKGGYRLMAQDYIEPKKVQAFLRKRGTNLEEINWHNRVCVKYVAEGDPNAEEIPSVALTGIEVTLGPEIIPAGRRCAFTAGSFA
jgi:hypothetical protein